MDDVMDVWRAGAPRIDILSPDAYNYFEEWCAKYDRSGNPLFIPETGPSTGFGDQNYPREMRAAVNVFYALGQHDAMGFSPFGLESLPDLEDEIGKSYGVLSQLAPLILENQGKGAMGGVVLDKEHTTQKLRVGDYTLDVGIARHWTFPTPDYPAGIFIAVGPDEYVVAGRGLTVAFSPSTPGPPAGFATVDEGVFVNGRWVAGRRLNGDEILSGKGLRLRGDRYMIQRAKLYRYR